LAILLSESALILIAYMLKTFTRFVVLAIICVLLVRRAGDFLVVERLHKADVIVVLAGDNNDVRYSRGLELIRDGYSPKMFVDASQDRKWFGHSYVELARRFIEEDPNVAQQVKVCPIHQDSTDAETRDVETCIGNAPSVLLVTSDFHTRRALSIFEKRLPNHVFYAGAAHDPAVFGARWWEHREWAKTASVEWQKLLWWQLVERWR
jgi:hypothetical protein